MSTSVYLPNYTVGVDAYDKIGDVCSFYGRKVAIIGGKTALAKARPYLEAGLAKSELEATGFIWYGGNSSMENVDKLVQNPDVQAADMLFAVGGGRSLDTIKMAGEIMSKPVFTFPTIGSNCSSTTAVSVVYTATGEMVGLSFMKKPPLHTFINTQIIAEAPEQYLWAGIGDALSKQVESAFSSRADDLDHKNALGVQIAQMCNARLIKYGAQALQDAHNHKPSYAVEQVILDIYVSTGLTSVLVINDYNSALAHSIYYGTTVLSRLEDHLHGEIVSYGVLVLLTMDKQYEMRDEVFNFMKAVGLPTKLSDIDVSEDSDIQTILDKVMTTGDIVHVPYEITRDMIYDSMMELESYNA